jgi:hypothetical protein
MLFVNISKNRQHNGKNKKYKRTNNIYKTYRRTDSTMAKIKSAKGYVL